MVRTGYQSIGDRLVIQPWRWWVLAACVLVGMMLCAGVVGANVVNTSFPAFYDPFNTSGDLTRSSDLNHYTITNTGGFIDTNTSHVEFGGGALNLTGGYLTLNQSPFTALHNATIPYTIIAHVIGYNPVATSYLFYDGGGNSNMNGINIRELTSRQFSLFISNGTGNGIYPVNNFVSSVIPADNNYHEVRLVYNISGWSWLVDGGSVTYLPKPNTYFNTSIPTQLMSIGQLSSGTGLFNSTVDDLTIIYNANISTVVIQDTEFLSDPTASQTLNVSSSIATSAPVVIQFTNTSIGNVNVTTHIWNVTPLGSGTTTFSTSPSPTYTISVPGNYSFSHTVTNPFGQSTAQSWVNVTWLAPVASYSATLPSPQSAPVTVGFNDTSTNAPTSYQWQVNGGAVLTTQNITATFSFAGTEWINHTATNSGGTSAWDNATYIVTAPFLTGGFSGTPLSGTVPLTVTFTDASTNATGWSYTFGDGGSSTSQNPVYTYSVPGTYTVVQTVTNTYGSSPNITTKTNYVAVNPMVVTFSGTPRLGPVPLTVAFTGSSTGSPDVYFWIFGDGNTTGNTLQNPVHLYTVPGIYSVNFSATNISSGSTAWSNQSNYITSSSSSSLLSMFTPWPIWSAWDPLVNLTDASTGSPTNCTISWGDSVVEYNCAPFVMHQYQMSGIYPLDLTVTNAGGNSTNRSWIQIME